MKTLRSIVCALAVALVPAGAALSAPPVRAPSVQSFATPVAADCYSVGQAVAAQNGGQLATANAVQRNGQTFCEIVILVPGRDGGRPRRAAFTVPAN